MNQVIKAVYHNGAFIPSGCRLRLAYGVRRRVAAFSLPCCKCAAPTGRRFLLAMLNSGDQSPHSKSCRRLNPIAIRYNVLIYVHDPRDSAKQVIANSLVNSLSDGVLLWQVACEFIAASRKLARYGFSRDQAWQEINLLKMP